MGGLHETSDQGVFHPTCKASHYAGTDKLGTKSLAEGAGWIASLFQSFA